MSTIAINVNYSGSVNFTASFPPAQRIIAGNNTNPLYLRYAMLTQDSLQMVYYTASVVIPITSLYQAAFTAYPALTYPPAIIQQPIDETINLPDTASFYVIVQSEVSPVLYQWYVESGSSAPFVLPVNGGGATYTGQTTPALTASYTAAYTTSSLNFFCAISSSRGLISSSIANLTL